MARRIAYTIAAANEKPPLKKKIPADAATIRKANGNDR
jgi:hypothetical protein